MTDPYPTGPVVYILRNGKSLYVGATIDLSHRIRQHNGELSGGEHRTSTKGPGWDCLLYVGGIAPCARSASRGIAWHHSAHLGIPRAPRGGAVAMAGEVYGDASDRWGGATSRTSLPLTRRADTRNGPHGGRTAVK